VKSIAIVTNSLTGGGAERSMNLLGDELVDAGWDVYLVPVNSSDSDTLVIKSKVVQVGRTWHGTLNNSLQSFKNFSREIRVIPADIIVLNCDLPEFLSVFIPLKKSIIVVEHTTNAWKGRRFLGFLIRIQLILRKARWVRVSSHIKPWPVRRIEIETIPNIVKAVDLSLSCPNQPIKRLVFIGRFSSEKNPELFLDISIASGVPALMIGEGVVRQNLEKIASSKQCEIEFTGFIKNPWSRISPGDLVVITSSYEGDGLVLLEAVLRGIPVLVRNVPDLARFNLPAKNYFLSVKNASDAILNNFEDIGGFQVPDEIRKSLTAERSKQAVIKKWETFLNQFKVP